MQYRSTFAFTVLATLAACGDNRSAAPDAGPPYPDGGTGPTCRLDLSADALAGGSWDPRFTVPGFTRGDGTAPRVFDFARDIDGSLVAAGEFAYLGSTHVEPLLRLRNGVWEPARTTWELTPPGSGFSAVAIAPDGALALATYDDFGDRSGEIWLDDGTGLRVIGSFDGLIRSLAWYDGRLWAAGWNVIHDGASGIQGLAVWDGTGWAAPPGGPLDAQGFAFELVVDGDELLVGGFFEQIGGISAHSVAAYDGAAWRALDFPGGVAVYALARGADDTLYAGGAFGELDAGGGGLASWNGSQWVLAAGGVVNRAFPGVVTDLVQHAGSLYVSGCFHSVGGTEDTPGAVVSVQVARFDGTWHSLDDGTAAVLSPWYEERTCGDEGPDSVWTVSKQRMISHGDRLLLAGSFPGIANVMSPSVIAHDGAGWIAEGPTDGLGLGGQLDKIGVSATGCEVWGTGTLSHIAGEPSRARVVHFTGTEWQPIADSIPSDAFCPGFAVSPTGDVALGCMIFPLEGDALGRVYRVRGDQLVAVDAELPLVQSLAYDADGRLWIGGGGDGGFLARLEGDTVTMVEDGFDAPVAHIDPVAADDVIVAGYFSRVGEVDAQRIARWDGTTWRALGAGLPGLVTAIAHDGAKVYASTVDDGTGAYLLGAFDGSTWTELASPARGLTPHPHFNFNAISVIDGAVVAVGSAELDDGSGRGALVFRDGRFEPLGGGVHGISLSGLAVSHDAIWVAGTIAEAGVGTGATPTVGVARYQIAR